MGSGVSRSGEWDASDPGGGPGPRTEEVPDAPAAPAPTSSPSRAGPVAGAGPVAAGSRDAGPAGGARLAHREKAVGDALRTLARDLHHASFGRSLPRMETVELVIRARIRPDENWAVQFEGPLVEQLQVQLEEAQASRVVFRRGRIYCHRCESSDCPHAVPPGPLQVFTGYSANGTPRWTELAQALLDGRHEQVDQLFEGRPRVLTHVLMGGELKADQLHSHGRSSKSYSVLGQVIAGYFPLARRPPDAGDDARIAITFQAVETRGPRGELELELNPIVRTPGGIDLDELLVDGLSGWVHRAYRLACRDLDRVEDRCRDAGTGASARQRREAFKEVPRVLRALARSLESGHTQSTRRTRHVEERRRQNRPVHKALEDASTVSPRCMFADERSSSIVICGPSGRAHAFTGDGRHVTSFILKPEAIDHRVRTGRWKPLDPERAASLIARIRSGEGR